MSMNRQYNPVTPRARAPFAGVAALAKAGMVWAVIALAVRDDDEFVREAKAQAAVVTQHALAPAAASAAQPRLMATARSCGVPAGPSTAGGAFIADGIGPCAR
jgi:hypothetical protein